MEVENRIILGEVDTLGGVLYLPLHWVSVVVNFQQQQILYGKSLKQEIPSQEHDALEHWINIWLASLLCLLEYQQCTYVPATTVDRHITHYVFFSFFFPQLILH